MPTVEQLMLQKQQELTRILRALQTLSEKQLTIALEDREELLSKKQILLDELTSKNISTLINTALISNDIKCKAEAEKHVEFLMAIENIEKITLKKWYNECEKNIKDMQDNSDNQQLKSQYKDSKQTNVSRFLDDKR